MENSLRIRNAKEGRDVTSSVVSPSCSLMYGKCWAAHCSNDLFHLQAVQWHLFLTSFLEQQEERELYDHLYCCSLPSAVGSLFLLFICWPCFTWFPFWGAKDERNIWKCLHCLIYEWSWNCTTDTFISRSNLFYHTTPCQSLLWLVLCCQSSCFLRKIFLYDICMDEWRLWDWSLKYSQHRLAVGGCVLM